MRCLVNNILDLAFPSADLPSIQTIRESNQQISKSFFQHIGNWIEATVLPLLPCNSESRCRRESLHSGLSSEKVSKHANGVQHLHRDDDRYQEASVLIWMCNSHVHRIFPGKFESSNLSRENLSREIGRNPRRYEWQALAQPTEAPSFVSVEVLFRCRFSYVSFIHVFVRLMLYIFMLCLSYCIIIV